ncbi:unnamed protein product [Allacma fusca]|uniref:C2H2-type domain-containing protein n=1 Tax=Allacma fusca TaxID=39272 RepID=A0A8J2NMB5_9HEXA|nr:unnamed protein product [Allacma fusca]
MSTVVEDSALLYLQIQHLPSQIRCAVCSVKCDNVIDDNENPSEDMDKSSDDRKPTLEALCSILKVSNMCEAIGNSSKKSVKDFPQEKLFCSVCYKRILEGLKIRKNIETLQVELTDIITNLKSSIVLSYERQNKENLGETELEMFVRMLRHTLFQCWTTVKVQLNPLLSSKKRRPRTPSRSKIREFVPTNPPLIGPILLRQESTEDVDADPQTVSFTDDFGEEAEVESHPDRVDDKVASAIAGPDEAIILEHDLRTSKVKVGSFQCTLCDKIFCREVNLKVHQTRKHGRMTGSSRKNDNRLNKFKCAHCEKIFPESESTLAKTNKSMFKCEVPGCKQIVATYDHLKSHHQRTCPQRHLLPARMKQNALYRCDPCSKSFETVTAYKHHQLSIHEKKFKYFCEHQKNFDATYVENFLQTVTEEHSDKNSKMGEKEKETTGSTGCEDAQSNKMNSNSSTTIVLHIDEGIVENISENHTI